MSFQYIDIIIKMVDSFVVFSMLSIYHPPFDDRA